jgi:hypothetical protein
MTDELLQQLRAEVERATGLPDEEKARILGHVEAIEKYTSGKIADRAQARSGLDQLSSALEELEDSHPAITTVVGRVAVALGNMGI